jgi:hypothetical protein
MTKDYTDYVLTIYGSGERIIHDFHLTKRQLGVRSVTLKEANFNPRFKYLFDGFQDRAFQTKLSPWRKWDQKHPFGSIKEFVRAKRIGHLHYLEPSDPNAPDDVEPIHVSRVHQPSGRLEGQEPELIETRNGEMMPGLMEEVTPFALKTLVDNNFYMQAYKSFKFGFHGALAGKWIWFVIAAVVVIVLILFFTGNIPGMGGG